MIVGTYIPNILSGIFWKEHGSCKYSTQQSCRVSGWYVNINTRAAFVRTAVYKIPDGYRTMLTQFIMGMTVTGTNSVTLPGLTVWNLWSMFSKSEATETDSKPALKSKRVISRITKGSLAKTVQLWKSRCDV